MIVVNIITVTLCNDIEPPPCDSLLSSSYSCVGGACIIITTIIIESDVLGLGQGVIIHFRTATITTLSRRGSAPLP